MDTRTPPEHPVGERPELPEELMEALRLPDGARRFYQARFEDLE